MSYIGKVSNFLDFGAVKLNPYPKPIPCTSNALYCQPTEQLDDIAFQYEVSESTDLITNGSFTASVGGWTVVGWGLVYNGVNWYMNKNAVVNALSQKGILTVNDYYRVTLTISDYTAGTLIVGGGTGSVIYSGAITTQANGTYEVYFQYQEPAGAGDFIIQGSSTFAGSVDTISVVKISDVTDYTIQIINQETAAVIDTVPAANMRLNENLMTVAFNWTDDVTVSNGCRQIQIIDNTNLFEDTMTTNQGWTITSDITYPGTRQLYSSTGADGYAYIDGVFVIGETYEFTMITTGMAGTGALFLQCGKAVGTTRSTNNTFVEEITCTHNSRLWIRYSGGAGSSAGVDNLTIKKVGNIAARSECYDLQTSHDCSLIFKWSNGENWGGFNYDTPAVGDPFNQELRVIAKFRGSKYPTQRLIGEDSKGLKSVDYTSFRKAKILDIHIAPEYIHDAIASMFVQDTRTIDDVSYILVDEYEPSSPSDSVVLYKDMMTARIELEPTSQPNQINRQ